MTCEGGTYLFTVHLATHKDKKALISIRKNGKDVANIIAQVRLIYSEREREIIKLSLIFVYFFPGCKLTSLGGRFCVFLSLKLEFLLVIIKISFLGSAF